MPTLRDPANSITPEGLAIALTQRFFYEGSFDGNYGTGARTATAVELESVQAIEEGAAGLGLQAIGFADSGTERAVHVYASRGSASHIRSLNTELGNIPVLFHKMGQLKVYSQLSGSTNRGMLYQHNGFVGCGSSCAPSNETYSGTFGALIKDDAARMFLLSNNHVIAACNHAAPGIPILSPSAADSHQSLPAPREIGTHSHMVELRSGDATLVPESTVDAAIADAKPDAVSSWQGEGIDGYDTPPTWKEPEPGMRVKKWGRTTGLTRGVVEAQLVRLVLPYKSKSFSAIVYFKDVYSVREESGGYFALPGDSGSLVVTEEGSDGIGLVFATSASANGNYAIVTPLGSCLAELERASRLRGFEVVSGHNV